MLLGSTQHVSANWEHKCVSLAEARGLGMVGLVGHGGWQRRSRLVGDDVTTWNTT